MSSQVPVTAPEYLWWSDQSLLLVWFFYSYTNFERQVSSDVKYLV